MRKKTEDFSLEKYYLCHILLEYYLGTLIVETVIHRKVLFHKFLVSILTLEFLTKFGSWMRSLEVEAQTHLDDVQIQECWIDRPAVHGESSKSPPVLLSLTKTK